MPIPHPWSLSPKQAIALQNKLASQIDTSSPIDLDNLQLVAGVDVSVKNNISRAAIAVLRFPSLELVEAVTHRQPTAFPYISGLLTFREGEVILRALDKLSVQPDVFIFDGQGIAHPRRMGIAAHMGLWFKRPTVGCAKKRLTGVHAELPEEKGCRVPLLDRQGDDEEVLGYVLRTRTGVKPVYVSPGHMATPATACELVLRCTTRYRLPETTRAAHNIAGDFNPE